MGYTIRDTRYRIHNTGYTIRVTQLQLIPLRMHFFFLHPRIPFFTSYHACNIFLSLILIKEGTLRNPLLGRVISSTGIFSSVTMVFFLQKCATYPFFSQLFVTYLYQEKRGGVVQLVERMLCTHEVIGSSPIISTSKVFVCIFFLKQNKNPFRQRNKQKRVNEGIYITLIFSALKVTYAFTPMPLHLTFSKELRVSCIFYPLQGKGHKRLVSLEGIRAAFISSQQKIIASIPCKGRDTKEILAIIFCKGRDTTKD